MSLSVQLQNLAVRVGSEIKAVRTLVNDNSPSNAALLTTAKGNLVAAINELKAEITALASAEGGATIVDGAVSTTSVWSSSKTNSEIAAQVAALVGEAPEVLDTLVELANALGDDPNFAATMSAALGLRVRVDAPQSLTGPQQSQARSNIGAASDADLTSLANSVGNTEHDFVGTFEAAL